METPHTQVLSQVGRFYSAGQIYLASFLGSPMAAAWFFSRNYLTMSDELQARRALWLGLAATAVAFAIAFVLPHKVPYFLWPLLYSSVVQLYAYSCFHTFYEKHIGQGGAKGSWWAVVGISLGICVALSVLAVACLISYARLTDAQIDWDPRH
jgi:hypothetical protein